MVSKLDSNLQLLACTVALIESKLRRHGVLMEHAPFDPGSESDIEEDEPDEPGDSNMSMSQFEDENNAKLASSSLADPDLAAAQEQNKKRSRRG